MEVEEELLDHRLVEHAVPAAAPAVAPAGQPKYQVRNSELGILKVTPLPGTLPSPPHNAATLINRLSFGNDGNIVVIAVRVAFAGTCDAIEYITRKLIADTLPAGAAKMSSLALPSYDLYRRPILLPKSAAVPVCETSVASTNSTLLPSEDL